VHKIRCVLPKFLLSVHVIHAVTHQSTHKLRIATALILQHVLVYHIVNKERERERERECVCVCVCVCVYIYIYIYIYTGCPRRNVPDFGRMFLMLKYTDITQNTHIQS